MPSIKNLYVLISRDIATDTNDKMTSIMKIIEKFTFTYNPKQMAEQGVTLGEKPILFGAKYYIATSWLFDNLLKNDTFLTFKVTTKSPSGKKQEGPSQEHLIPSGIDRVNMNFSMNGLPVNESGKHSLLVEVHSKDGKKLSSGEYPFVVELMEDKKSQ